jgi:hypothetical protein
MVHIVRYLLRAREYFRNRVVRRSIVKKLGNVGDLVDYGLVLKDTSCIDPLCNVVAREKSMWMENRPSMVI